MKTLLPLLTLFCLLTFSSSSVKGPQEVLKKCCPSHRQVPVPRNKIKDVVMTDSTCHLKAVIVTTKNGKMLCVDPDWEWSQRRLAEFRAAPTASPTP